MTTCAICGSTHSHTSSYQDRAHAIYRPIEICDRCLFQHVAFHYPGSPIYHILLDHDLPERLNLTPLEALIQLPPRSITQRLAEIPFTISYWAKARKENVR